MFLRIFQRSHRLFPMENKLLKTPPRLFFQDGKDFETASPEKTKSQFTIPLA